MRTRRVGPFPVFGTAIESEGVFVVLIFSRQFGSTRPPIDAHTRVRSADSTSIDDSSDIRPSEKSLRVSWEFLSAMTEIGNSLVSTDVDRDRG